MNEIESARFSDQDLLDQLRTRHEMRSRATAQRLLEHLLNSVKDDLDAVVYLRPGGLSARSKGILKVLFEVDRLRRADLSAASPIGQLDLETSIKLGQIVTTDPPAPAVVAARKLGYTPADPDENVGPVLRNNPKL